MSSLTQLRNGLSHAWENMSEGWHHLQQRGSQALTRFNPIARKDEDSHAAATTQWGLLAAEVEESPQQITVRLEAPGMDADDFTIQVIDNYLVVRGEKRTEQRETRGHYSILECAYGRFERALELPASVEEDKAAARYKRGVLTVTLPRSKQAKQSRIEVKRT